MKILVMGSCNGDVSLINKYLEQSHADICLSSGNIGIFPKDAKNIPNGWGNQFWEYLYRKKTFDKPVYSVVGPRDNISLVEKIQSEDIFIPNFCIFGPEGCIIPQQTDSFGNSKIDVCGVGGSYSPKTYENGRKTYKDKTHFIKKDIDSVSKCEILLLHDVIGGCSHKDIVFSDPFIEFIDRVKPHYCFVGKFGRWGSVKLGITSFVSLPRASDGYLIIDTEENWNSYGVRFDLED